MNTEGEIKEQTNATEKQEAVGWEQSQKSVMSQNPMEEKGFKQKELIACVKHS